MRLRGLFNAVRGYRFTLVLGAISVAAWALLMTLPPSIIIALCGWHSIGEATAARASVAWAVARPADIVMAISLMTLLMAPLMAAALRHVHQRSFAAYRGLLAVCFVTGYFTVWFGASAAAGAVMFASLVITGGGLIAPSVAIVVAVVWQCSPWKQQVLNRCHRRLPLRAFGSGAVGDAARYGVRSACYCVLNCWPLMVAAMMVGLPDHLAMLAAVVFVIVERSRPPRVPVWTIPRFGVAWLSVSSAMPRTDWQHATNGAVSRSWRGSHFH